MRPIDVAALNVRNDMIGVCFYVVVGLVILISAIDFIQQRRRKD